MASTAFSTPRRARNGQEHHVFEDVVHAVSSELHHLKEIEEKGDSPLTALIVLAQVSLGLIVIVSLEIAIAMSFYFGWL